VNLELSENTPFVDLVLLDTLSVGQPRGVDYTDLGKRLQIFITFTNVGTYLHAIVARKFVKAGRVGLALVAGTTSLVGTVEYVEVIFIDVVSNEDIGD